MPIDLPQSQAKSLDQDKEPLTLSVNDKGQVFLQNAEISVDDLIPKLQAVAQARGGTEARVYVRGDKGRLRDHDEGDGAAIVGPLPSGSLGHRIRAGLDGKVMRKAAAISTGLHAAVLLWALVSFSGKTFEVAPAESLPVDLINDKDFSELTKGSKSAPKAEKPKPLVEKIADTKPAEEIAPSPPRKKRSRNATAEKTSEPQPLPKPDPIAEKLKKQDEQKEGEGRAPAAAQEADVNAAAEVQRRHVAALLDSRAPQRNSPPARRLRSQMPLRRDWARNGGHCRFARCAPVPDPRMLECSRRRADAEKLVICPGARFLNPRRKLGAAASAGAPKRAAATSNPYMRTAAEAALRARTVCEPYKICCRPIRYQSWREIVMTFDPSRMIGP